MAEQELNWLVPGLMQLPVCLALNGAGFNFEDLNSTVRFLFAFHYIMMAFKAFFRYLFRYLFHQDGDEVFDHPPTTPMDRKENPDCPYSCFTDKRYKYVYWSIVIFNAVTQIILQIWGCSAVSGFLWKNNYNSCEKTPTTVISAIIIVSIETIECVLAGIMLVKIAKCMWEKRPQSDGMNSTNSRTIGDKNGPKEAQRRLLPANNHTDTDTENEIDSLDHKDS